MNDSHEPSYYEVSLTNRQVLFSFVVVLVLFLMVFVFGAWLGRRSCVAVTAEGTGLGSPGGIEQGSRLDGLEPFDGAPDDAGDELLDKPDLSQLAETPRTDTTLAQDVGEEPVSPPSTTSPPPARETPQSTPPPPVVAPPPPAPPPSRAPPTTAEPTTGFVIQVLSSRDRAKAEDILARLRDGGHRAYLSPREANGVTMFRVRVGPYDDKAEAERLAPELKRRYRVETWVTAADN